MSINMRQKHEIAPNRRMRKMQLRFAPWVRKVHHRGRGVLDSINPRMMWYYRNHLERYERHRREELKNEIPSPSACTSDGEGIPHRQDDRGTGHHLPVRQVPAAA